MEILPHRGLILLGRGRGYSTYELTYSSIYHVEEFVIFSERLPHNQWFDMSMSGSVDFLHNNPLKAHVNLHENVFAILSLSCDVVVAALSLSRECCHEGSVLSDAIRGWTAAGMRRHRTRYQKTTL